jgi:hypothetical protein
MAYTISNTDGSTLTLLAENAVDENTTSISLIGRNVNGFGEFLNNNLVKMTANFANDTINPPRNPLKGQLWYDTTAKKIKVYDNGFRTVSGATISPTLPSSLTTGDLWFDSTNNQLKIVNDNSTLLVGPAFSYTIGENGWVLPSSSIRDDNLYLKNVTLLKNFGRSLGILSHEAYTVNPVDSNTFFNTSTMAIVSGLKILGDINYTGKINNNYNTLSVDLDFITLATNNISNLTHFTSQTNVIIGMLNSVFPINSQTNFISHPANINSYEAGVPVGSEARVVCSHTVPFKGYQIRRFVAKSNATWDYVNLTTSLIFNTLSNVITTIALT